MTAKKPCPFCQNDCELRYKASDYNRRINDVVFHMYGCPACGLLFISDPPANMGQYYEMGKLPTTLTDEVSRNKRLAGERYKLEIIKNFITTGTLLDIGPNMGEFAFLAQVDGFDVSVIECDPDSVAFLNEHLTINVIESCDPANVLQQNQENFDIICLWQAIEHLPEPWAVLEAAKKRLNTGGIIIISTPNPKAWQLTVLGSRWPHLDMPRHRFLLPSDWILRRAQEMKLRPLLLTSRDVGSRRWERLTWSMFLLNLFEPNNPLSWKIFWNLGILIGRLTQPFMRSERRGATYTLILQNGSK